MKFGYRILGLFTPYCTTIFLCGHRIYSVSQSHEVHPHLFTATNSQFPIPNSQRQKTLYLTNLVNAISIDFFIYFSFLGGRKLIVEGLTRRWGRGTILV